MAGTDAATLASAVTAPPYSRCRQEAMRPSERAPNQVPFGIFCAIVLRIEPVRQDAQHENMEQPAAFNALAVQIHPEHADQAFVAGVRFSWALIDSEPTTFMMAPGDQAVLIRNAVHDAAYSNERAHLAVEAGARHEWRRIVSLEQPALQGNA